MISDGMTESHAEPSPLPFPLFPILSRGCAQDMGQQLDAQGAQIKTVSEKVDRNTEKQKSVMGKLTKIVGKKSK